MLKEINKQTIKNNGDYVAEIELLDTDDNKSYYVVAQIGNNLLYATFDGSYVGYLNNTNEKPSMLEGDKVWWFYEANTRFCTYYDQAYVMAVELESSESIKRRHAHLKKPLGNIKYEIVYRNNEPRFACGPMGDVYEIKFHILDNDIYLYMYSTDACDFYALSDFSYFELEEKMIGGEDPVIPDPIESFEGFYKAKKSKYYDLYLEMERFRDGLPSLLEK